MTINELLSDALAYEESFLAHAIYTGIKSGVLKGDDSADGDIFENVNLEEAHKLHQQNILGIQSVKLYASPLSKSMFAMFFAESEEIARKLYKKEFRKECSSMHRLEYGLDASTYNLETKEHRTWREERDSLPELPAYAGIFEKDWLVIRREEDERAKAKAQKKSAEAQRARGHQ